MNKCAVIKVGGDVLQSEESTIGLAKNVKDLTDLGCGVIILHGGGPQINTLQEKHGLIPNKVGGRRITGEKDLLVVTQALCGEVNVKLTSALLNAGVNAFGCHGASGKIIGATKRPPVCLTGTGDKPIDFGEVGDVSKINRPLLLGLLNLKVIPVIATLGVSETGRIFNINADNTVIRIAESIKAEMLLFTTKIGGIYRDINDPSSRIPSIKVTEVQDYISSGVITDGMIPKIESAAKVVERCVSKVAIVGPDEPGVFASVAKGSNEFGTVIHC
ncbi:MAG: acetylglutamate kinase [Desulfobacterales bacterium]|nr:acetylglutamate kinase [Desulfobacterales bacterium]MCP4163126.1 acetylglutamate kinase [Deltaproteobacteria bacterium]